MSDTLRCSELARARHDPLLGTAVDAPRWLLVEQPEAWAPKAMATSPLVDVARELSPLLDAHGIRPQVIRRPGRRERGGAKRMALVDSTRGTARWGTWEQASDVVAAAGWATEELEPADPVVLVCAHGRKDVCCALEGRPVAATLADHFGDAVWETSHLGGDRFAANVAVLPDGAMYGRLDAAVAAGVVSDHLEGRVRLEHWRGRSGWAGHVSAAVAHVLEGLDGYAAGVAPVQSIRRGDDAWTVLVSTPDDEVAVDVTRRDRPAAQLSCGADKLKVSSEFTAGPTG